MSNIHGLNSAPSGGGSGGSGGSSGGMGGMMGGMRGGGGGGSCTEQVKAGWAKLPLFNKFVFFTCCAIYLLSFIVIQVLTYTMLIPIDVFRLHIWKLITGPFAHGQLLQLFFSLISYIPSAMYEEDEMGTVPFTIRFFKLSLFINVLFCALGLGLGFVMPMLAAKPLMGLWPILFCDMVIQCYKEPEMPRGLCCLPIEIKSKYYPLVLFAIFTIIFMDLDISLVTGLMVGYLYTFGWLKCLETSTESVRVWEKRWPFSKYKDDPNFRPTGSVQANNPTQNNS